MTSSDSSADRRAPAAVGTDWVCRGRGVGGGCLEKKQGTKESILAIQEAQGGG